MQNLTNKELLGLINEKVLLAILSSVFKGYKIKHNDFNRYQDGISRGVDFRVFERNKSLFDIEVKNWKLFNKPYGLDVIKLEILERFKNSCAKYKILIISFISLISTEGLSLLKRNNIHVFGVDRLIGKKFFDFKNRLFYELKAKFTKFLRSIPESLNTVQTNLNPIFLDCKVKCQLDTSIVDSLYTLKHSDFNVSIPQTNNLNLTDRPRQINLDIYENTPLEERILKEIVRLNLYNESLKQHGLNP